MGLSDAKVETTLGELKELTGARDRLELRVSELEAELDKLRIDGAGESAAALSEAFNHAYEIVRFAIANLDPLAVRGWPWASITSLAALMPDLAGVAPDIRECAPDLADFASRAKEWEMARDAGVEQQKHAEENAVKSVTLTDLFDND